MRRSRLTPAVAIGVASAACLVVFLASIPLPHVDGQLVGGDGIGYYSYLPSLVLEHDLDFANEYVTILPPGGRLFTARTPTGLSYNYWPVGPPLLWLPFFLVAHGLALLLTAGGIVVRLDGLGYWHQAFVICGNIAYGGTAMWLAFRTARRVARDVSAMWAVLLVAFGGNLAYYMTAEASLAHATAAFAVSLFFAVWMRLRGRSEPRQAALLGALAGLVAVVRTQDLVLLLVPIAAEVTTRFGSARGRGPSAMLASLGRDAVLAVVAAVVVYSPQFFVSSALYGAWWKPPQLQVGWIGFQVFTWQSPRFWSVLFSPQSGLLTWHPIVAFALLGAVPLWRRDRPLAAALVTGVLAQTYVTGGWHDWAQGRAFGARTFVSCLPLFAAGLAALIDATRRLFAARPVARRALLAGTAAFLLAANLLLAVEFRADLAYTSRRPTWHDLGVRRVTFLIERFWSSEF
jgi:hypothetical protein